MSSLKLTNHEYLVSKMSSGTYDILFPTELLSNLLSFVWLITLI